MHLPYVTCGLLINRLIALLSIIIRLRQKSDKLITTCHNRCACIMFSKYMYGNLVWQCSKTLYQTEYSSMSVQQYFGTSVQQFSSTAVCQCSSTEVTQYRSIALYCIFNESTSTAYTLKEIISQTVSIL